MRIGVDMDDVLNNLVEFWIKCYNKDYNDNLSIEDIKSWDIGEFTKAGKDFYKYLGDEKLFKSLSIKPRAAEIIEKLCKEHEVYIVTANASYNKGVCDDKVDFVKKYMPFFPIKNIIFIQNKGLLNLEVLIDDGLHNFEGFNGYRVIFDRPWNRIEDDIHYYRMYCWDEEIVNTINEWSEQIDLMMENVD